MKKIKWTYNPRTLCLEYSEDGEWDYEVYLGDCTTCARLLDWVFQVQPKVWATPPVIHTMLEAIDDQLEVQRNYCSGGGDRGPVDVKKLLRGHGRKVYEVKS